MPCCWSKSPMFRPSRGQNHTCPKISLILETWLLFLYREQFYLYWSGILRLFKMETFTVICLFCIGQWRMYHEKETLRFAKLSWNLSIHTDGEEKTSWPISLTNVSQYYNYYVNQSLPLSLFVTGVTNYDCFVNTATRWLWIKQQPIRDFVWSGRRFKMFLD